MAVRNNGLSPAPANALSQGIRSFSCRHRSKMTAPSSTDQPTKSQAEAAPGTGRPVSGSKPAASCHRLSPKPTAPPMNARAEKKVPLRIVFRSSLLR